MNVPKDHLRGPQNSTWATHPSWQKVVDLTNSSQPSPAGTAAGAGTAGDSGGCFEQR